MQSPLTHSTIAVPGGPIELGSPHQYRGSRFIMKTPRSRMTNLLKEAFDKASELPQKEQDTFARFLLAKLESEAQWADAFARSQDVLAKLADEALEEFIAGETEILDPDNL